MIGHARVRLVHRLECVQTRADNDSTHTPGFECAVVGVARLNYVHLIRILLSTRECSHFPKVRVELGACLCPRDPARRSHSPLEAT